MRTSDLPNWQSAHIPYLKGKFTQKKTTPHLSRPLQSSGTMVISVSQGLIWQTLKPIKTTYVITGQSVSNITPDGRQKITNGATELNLILINAFSGHWVALSEHFYLTPKTEDDLWCVNLTPKPRPSQQTLRRIDLCGTQQALKTMEIARVDGDIIALQLDLKPALALTKSEQQQLNNNQ